MPWTSYDVSKTYMDGQWDKRGARLLVRVELRVTITSETAESESSASALTHMFRAL